MTGYIEAAKRMWNMRRFDLAAEYYAKHLSVQPRDATALAGLAQVLWLGGRKQEAHVRLVEALEMDAQSCNVHQAAGRIHRWEGDWRKCLVHCDKALELHPSGDLHHLERSYALEMGKRIEEAFREVLRALELDPKDPDNHQQHVYLHMEYGKLEDAWKLCQEYLRLAPNRADAHGRRGWCLVKLGRKQEGEQAYLDALAIDPSLAWVRDNLAHLRKELGHVPIDREAKASPAATTEEQFSLEEIHDALKSMGHGALALAFLLVLGVAFVALAAWTASAILFGPEGGWPLVACLHACLAIAMLPWNHEYISLVLQRLSGGGNGGTTGLLAEVQLHALVVLALALAVLAIAQSSWFLAFWALTPMTILPVMQALLSRKGSART